MNDCCKTNVKNVFSKLMINEVVIDVECTAGGGDDDCASPHKNKDKHTNNKQTKLSRTCKFRKPTLYICASETSDIFVQSEQSPVTRQSMDCSLVTEARTVRPAWVPRWE